MFLFKNIVLFGASLNFEDLNVFFLTVSKIMLIMKLKKNRGFKLPLKRFVRNLSLLVIFFGGQIISIVKTNVLLFQFLIINLH